MREIKYIAIHCTAGSQRATVADLWAVFKSHKWKNPGYHYVITANGTIHQLLDEAKVSNGVKGWNSVTLNVAYTGGVDSKLRPTDNRTEAQRSAMAKLVKELHRRYPAAVIQGHRDFPNVAKVCPSFDVKAWLEENGIS